MFLFGRYEEADQVKRFPQLFPMLIDAGLRDPKMQEVVDEVIDERRRPIYTVVKLAQMRGEVSPDLDLDAAVATIVGPLTYRRIVERREVTSSWGTGAPRRGGPAPTADRSARRPDRQPGTPAHRRGRGCDDSRRRSASPAGRRRIDLVKQQLGAHAACVPTTDLTEDDHRQPGSTTSSRWSRWDEIVAAP